MVSLHATSYSLIQKGMSRIAMTLVCSSPSRRWVEFWPHLHSCSKEACCPHGWHKVQWLFSVHPGPYWIIEHENHLVGEKCQVVYYKDGGWQLTGSGGPGQGTTEVGRNEGDNCCFITVMWVSDLLSLSREDSRITQGRCSGRTWWSSSLDCLTTYTSSIVAMLLLIHNHVSF